MARSLLAARLRSDPDTAGNSLLAGRSPAAKGADRRSPSGRTAVARNPPLPDPTDISVHWSYLSVTIRVNGIEGVADPPSPDGAGRLNGSVPRDPGP